MTQYLQQLQADQTALETILQNRRDTLAQLGTDAGDPLTPKAIRPSVRLLHQAYMLIIEDALSILKSLIDYFTPTPEPP